MPTKTLRKVYVVAKLPRGRLAKLSFAKGVLAGMTKNSATFPSPPVPLATFASHVNQADAAQTATFTRAPGATDARNAKLVVLGTDIGLLRAYVQLCADLDPANAVTIAHMAGMTVRIVSIRVKPELELRQGLLGCIIAIAPSAKDKMHQWQHSLDGVTWIDAPSSLQARITLKGFAPGTKVYVRHRVVERSGPPDWGDAVAIIVR